MAIIFAPGAAHGGQNRAVTDELCPTTGTTIARKLCAANYLDIYTETYLVSGLPVTATMDNAVIGGPFIAAQSSSTFNDKVLFVTTEHLMPVVEQRVAREVIAKLKQYKDAVGVYPWADCADGSSDTDFVNRGRIPWRYPSLPVGGTTLPVNWGSSGAPYLPGYSAGPPVNHGWFVNNYWSWVIYYAAGKNYLQSSAANRPSGTPLGIECATYSCVDPTLTLSLVGPKEALIIMTGPAGVRPGGDSPRPDPDNPPGTSNYCNLSAWGQYLDDSANIKKQPDSLNSPLFLPTDDTFVRPVSTAYARDRLYACPGIPDICP